MAHKLTAQVSGGTVARYVQNAQIQAGGKGVANGFILSAIHSGQVGFHPATTKRSVGRELGILSGEDGPTFTEATHLKHWRLPYFFWKWLVTRKETSVDCEIMEALCQVVSWQTIFDVWNP